MSLALLDTPNPITVDMALAADFLADWEQSAQAAQAALIRMESGDSEALHALFRSLHSMKSGLRMVHLDRAADLAHALEDLLDDLRSGVLNFEHRLADLLLLCIHRIGESASRSLQGDTVDWQWISRLLPALRCLHREPQRAREHTLDALAELDPDCVDARGTDQPDVEADLSFFRRLAQLAESRCGFEAGRAARVEQMATQLNQLAGRPLDPAQLAAAAALHDVGMALLPRSLLAQESALDAQQAQCLHPHPHSAAQLLSELPHWGEARTIIQQHHERYDGSGYPRGLSGHAIHPGAALLAIVDTFEAMTQKRADRDHRRPVLRAVAEINALRERQFDPFWVNVFNRWVRQQFVAQRAGLDS